MKNLKNWVLLIIFTISYSCSTTTYNSLELDNDEYLERAEYKPIINYYQKKISSEYKNNADRVNDKLNYAMVLHYAGEYKKSTNVLLEIQDLFGLELENSAKEKLLSIFSEKLVKYQLEPYEIMSTSTVIILNSLMAKDLNSAYAEIKRQDRFMQTLISSGNEVIKEQSYFNSYLSSMVYERLGRNNKMFYQDSLIDLIRIKNNPYLKDKIKSFKYDILRVAYKAQRDDVIKSLMEEFKYTQNDLLIIKKQLNPRYTQVFVIQENGLAPFKVPHKQYSNIPVYTNTLSTLEEYDLVINNNVIAQTEVAFDFYEIAIKNLEKRYESALGRERAKSLLIDLALIPGIGTGIALASLATLSVNEATSGLRTDFRTWNYLFNRVFIGQLYLEKGSYDLEMKMTTYSVDKRCNLKFNENNTYFLLTFGSGSMRNRDMLFSSDKCN